MKAKPLVSVVIPAYAAGSLLAETAASVAAQAHRPLEIVIADDGSPEPVTAPEAGDIPVSVLRLAHLGPSAARNAGLRAARGDYVAFLDADDLWTGGALTALLGVFASKPEADAAQGRVRRFAHQGSDAAALRPQPYFGFNLGAILFARAALDRMGGFDETMRFSEDVDFLVRFQECGARRHLTEDIVLLYRRGHGSLTERAGVDRDGLGTVRQWARILAANLKRRRAAAGGR